MKYAARLARVADRCEARGIKVVRVSGWENRGRIKTENGRRYAQDMVSIESLIVHHTATGGREDYRSLKTVTDGRGDLAGPLSNWGGGRMGTLFLIAAGSANHTGATRELWQSNQYASGFEAENDGIGEPWSLPLKVCMTVWAQEMRKEFGVPQARVLGHREICVPVGRKPDPANFDMNEFRKLSDYPALYSILEDLVAQMSEDEKNRFMRFVDSQNRTWDERQKSKAVGHENDELWLSEGFMWTEANTARAAAASERTNQLLEELIKLEKAKA